MYLRDFETVAALGASVAPLLAEQRRRVTRQRATDVRLCRALALGIEEV
jgi:hypothetical protein